MRLDQRLRELHADLSWARIRQAIERGQVLVDGRVARDPGLPVTPGARVDLDLNRPALSSARLHLPRLYEDAEILVVDKPAGLLTIASHPSRRDTEDTVLARVRDYIVHRDGPRGYAGMLHRLDRDTSGALAVALSRAAHRAGRALFAEHRFDRRYLAIVHGVPDVARGTIDAPMAQTYVSGRRRIARGREAAREAVTHFTLREAFADAALVELRLETGRQHQIRAHLEHLGHPLVGERVYTGPPRRSSQEMNAPRPLLHAWNLSFPHPTTRAPVSVEADIPTDFAETLNRLRSRSPGR